MTFNSRVLWHPEMLAFPMRGHRNPHRKPGWTTSSQRGRGQTTAFCVRHTQTLRDSWVLSTLKSHSRHQAKVPAKPSASYHQLFGFPLLMLLASFTRNLRKPNGNVDLPDPVSTVCIEGLGRPIRPVAATWPDSSSPSLISWEYGLRITDLKPFLSLGLS